MKKLLGILSSVTVALALSIGIASLSSACLVHFHQPELPKALNNFRK